MHVVAQLTLLAWREEHVSADGFQHAGVARILHIFNQVSTKLQKFSMDFIRISSGCHLDFIMVSRSILPLLVAGTPHSASGRILDVFARMPLAQSFCPCGA